VTKRIWISVLLIWVGSRELRAQEEDTLGALTPLKVELTLSPAPDGRERGTSFTLYVLADSKRAVVLRAGREVAVPAPGIQYRNVGTNLTCRASTIADGFRLDLEIERSSLVEGSDAGRPSFHTFNANSVLRLRDGQTVELVGGSDLPEIRVRLQVLKD
jgi:hypothetical protein